MSSLVQHTVPYATISFWTLHLKTSTDQPFCKSRRRRLNSYVGDRHFRCSISIHGVPRACSSEKTSRALQAMESGRKGQECTCFDVICIKFRCVPYRVHVVEAAANSLIRSDRLAESWSDMLSQRYPPVLIAQPNATKLFSK